MIESRSSSSVIGDRVPAPVAAYFDALDARRFEDAAAQLAAGVLIALPPRGGHEVDPRRVARGREAAREMLALGAPGGARHQVIMCVGQDRSWYVEGLLRDPQDGRPVRTFVGHFDLDDGGLIGRYVAFACEP